MNEGLKPCPFCGAIPTVQELPPLDRIFPEETKREFPWIVLCQNNSHCFMNVSTEQCKTQEIAIAAWNTRTKPEEPAPPTR